MSRRIAPNVPPDVYARNRAMSLRMDVTEFARGMLAGFAVAFALSAVFYWGLLLAAVACVVGAVAAHRHLRGLEAGRPHSGPSGYPTHHVRLTQQDDTYRHSTQGKGVKVYPFDWATDPDWKVEAP